MKRWLFVVIFLMMACVASAAERVSGTKVSIEPPVGFERAEQFSGYLLRDAGASIMITEMPGPFVEVTKGFDSQGLVSQGMTLISKDVIILNGSEALLLNISQNARGIQFEKWIVVFGNEKETVLVTATFPAGEKALSDKLKQSILSTKWDIDVKVNSSEGLTFKVTESGGFKIAKKMGNNLILTFGGVFPVQAKNDPFILVGASASEKMPISDKKEFAKMRLYQTKTLTDFEILEEAEIVIAGLPGFRIIAKAKDTETGQDRLLYSAYLFSNDGYYIFQGFADFSQRREYQDIFASILESFKVN